jgi:predicted alpha/beta hydrolase
LNRGGKRSLGKVLPVTAFLVDKTPSRVLVWSKPGVWFVFLKLATLPTEEGFKEFPFFIG